MGRDLALGSRYLTVFAHVLNLPEQVLALGRISAAAPGPSSAVTCRSAPRTSTTGWRAVLGPRQVGGAGELVGDGDPRRLQLAPVGVGAPAPVLERARARRIRSRRRPGRGARRARTSR